MWSRNVHIALSRSDDVLNAVALFEKTCFHNLNDLASLVRGNLKSVDRTTLGALITLYVHARDIVSGLVHLKIDCWSDNNNIFNKHLY